MAYHVHNLNVVYKYIYRSEIILGGGVITNKDTAIATNKAKI